jgi:cytochrome P450
MTSQAVLPGPSGRFLLGSLQDFNRDTLKFLLEQRQYGDITQFRFGPFPVIVVNHPDYVHDVLVAQADKYYKATSTKQILGPVVGNGLFTSDGDFWKRQRRLVQPAFHTKRIGAYGKVMVDYAADLANVWQKGGVRAIDQDMTNLTMRIIAKTLFDADVTHEAPEVGKAIRDAAALIEESFRQIFTLPVWLPTPHNRKMRAATDRLDSLIQKFIDDRRASGEDKGDFLSLLLSAHDEDDSVMTDKQVRDEAMTLFGAGHETTAVTLMWVWYALSQRPEVEAKLHEELERVLAGRLPTLEDLPQLVYTEKIIKEAMRIYPPAWATTREPHSEVKLGGHTLKRGKNVILNIYGIHHDPRFYADPERFDPERFSPENEKNIPKYAYIPFGGGPRVCIGNAFSLMESRLLLATLAQRFHLSVAPNFTVVPDRQFTLRPKYGLQMVVTEREYARETATN